MAIRSLLRKREAQPIEVDNLQTIRTMGPSLQQAQEDTVLIQVRQDDEAGKNLRQREGYLAQEIAYFMYHTNHIGKMLGLGEGLYGAFEEGGQLVAFHQAAGGVRCVVSRSQSLDDLRLVLEGMDQT